MATRILVVGNHACANRGDAAILNGLISFLERDFSEVSIDVTSRHQVSSEYLLGRSFIVDEPHRYYDQLPGGRNGLISKLARRIVPLVLAWHVAGKWWRFAVPIPKFHKGVIAKYSDYSFVIQVGGSFFVDLYGVTQYDAAACALLAGRRVYAIGHSVGPFSGMMYRYIASTVFKRLSALALRERVSAQYLEDVGLAQKDVEFTGDTAWLVPVTVSASAKKKVVAFTFRSLAPFDRRLGVSQEQYELAFAECISSIMDLGYSVLAVSTCTPLENYSKDDRIVALRIKRRLGNPEGFGVLMDEVNDSELGLVLSECTLTVGTRLHSAIISMNFGTPAIAINYEHKSAGIMEQLGLPELSASLQDLIQGRLTSHIVALLSDPSIVSRVSDAVKREREFARNTICSILAVEMESDSAELGSVIER